MAAKNLLKRSRSVTVSVVCGSLQGGPRGVLSRGDLKHLSCAWALKCPEGVNPRGNLDGWRTGVTWRDAVQDPQGVTGRGDIRG